LAAELGADLETFAARIADCLEDSSRLASLIVSKTLRGSSSRLASLADFPARVYVIALP
jgi:hypothetical protein